MVTHHHTCPAWWPQLACHHPTCPIPGGHGRRPVVPRVCVSPPTRKTTPRPHHHVLGTPHGPTTTQGTRGYRGLCKPGVKQGAGSSWERVGALIGTN